MNVGTYRRNYRRETQDKGFPRATITVHIVGSVEAVLTQPGLIDKLVDKLLVVTTYINPKILLLRTFSTDVLFIEASLPT